MGNVVDILGVEDPRSEANFLSLMFFVMAIGCLACYYLLGWTMNVIGQVRRVLLYQTWRPLLKATDFEHQAEEEHPVIAAPSGPEIL
jgi:hypothetical protein